MNDTAMMFDLDGTLADTLADIAAAGNHMLTELGRDPQPVSAYRQLAGQGVRFLVEHALERDFDESMLERGVQLVLDYYAECGHIHVKPYLGIPELLDALVERGVTLAVLTNKPQSPADVLIESVYARWSFEVVRGARECTPVKPDPAGAHAVMEQLGRPAAHWLYVGDTRVDMLTGKSAGMFTVGVTWGFRDEPELRDGGADAIIHEPGALLELL